MADGTMGRGPMQSFTPGPGAERALRDALGCFGTGVTIVTCTTPDGPLGMTANSFSSVSLDPPLVLWSPAIASARHDAFVAAHNFAIHVLAADQSHLALQFSRGGRDFTGIDWRMDARDLPELEGSLARFVCTHHTAHGAGDHTMVLGQVIDAATRGGDPLLFVQGRYGVFSGSD